MSRRARLLAIFIGSLFLLFLVGWGISSFMLKPLKEIDKQTMVLRDKMRQIKTEQRAYFTSDDYLKGIAQHTFGHDPDVATAQAGKMVTDQIMRLGLPESDFNRTPVGPRKLRGAQEVGWSVQGEGPLAKVVDLLFVLEQTPQIHRLENLVISAGDRPGKIKARFRYLTLVVDAVPEPKPIELKPKWTLQSPERGYYDAIAQRDILRPYVPKPLPDVKPASTENSNPGARLEMLKVVSLSEWNGVPEIHICDLASMQVTRYKPGDKLADGQIIMIDYRTLPMPGQPGLFSSSRVIFKTDTAYWAVEHGKTLADKYQLNPEQYPPNLPKL